MKQRLPVKKRLRAGQSMHLHASHGMTIVATQGSLRISGAADWRGEHLVKETVLLQEGEAHLIQEAGWIVMSAQRDAEMVCTESPAEIGATRELLSGLLSLMRRRIS